MTRTTANLALAACFLLVGLTLLAGDAPLPPESSLNPARTNGTVVSRTPPPPSARVTVAIPSQGGQPSVWAQSAPDTSGSPSPYRAYSAESFTSDPYSSMAKPAASTNGEASGHNTTSGRILASLEGREITELDVTRELWARRGQETLDWMVGKAVLEQELTRLGLSITDAEVETRLSQHMDDLAKVFPSIASRDDLARAASGMGVEEYRERSVWVELALRKVVRENLKPTEDQLRVYFAERQSAFVEPDRVRISQIFIAPPSGPDGNIESTPAARADAERLILEAHSRLRLGEEFHAVASSYATGTTTARWVERGDLMRELEEAAFSLRPGAVSAPIRTGMGYHIIKVEERRERKLPRFEEVRDKVLEEYENKFFLAAAGDFMTRLKEKAIRERRLIISTEAETLSGGR